jgi:response regulator RpfG family c-di-GMP phosphodiesterase
MKKTILIVEDEISERKALKDKFTREGIDIIEAVNGEEGLKTAFKKHPDLIVTDILMPKMNGMEMIKKLREDKWGQSVPIVILTNVEAERKDVQKIKKDHRFACYLIKSGWKIQDIVDKVKKELEIK